MRSLKSNNKPTGRRNISDLWPRFQSTKLAAAAIRILLTLPVLCTLILAAARPAQAQTEKALYNFCSQPNCVDGSVPESRLTSDGAGNFYGTTWGGGAFGSGTVFEISPDGSGGWTETVLYSFCPDGGICTDGAFPSYSYVIFDSVGNLYGTTSGGGTLGYGVVFELSPVGTNWTETVLFSFGGGGSGTSPVNGLIMDTAGDLFGVTNASRDGTQTVFELSQSGGVWTEQIIYIPGGYPNNNDAGLTMDSAGNIFGTTLSTVFELAANGVGGWNPSVIHTFTGYPDDGSAAQSAPVIGPDGNLYGTTTSGGKYNYGAVYRLGPGKNGEWTERIVYSFNDKGKLAGSDPFAGLIFDGAGNMYGTTLAGVVSYGSVFELTPVGTDRYKERVLWGFESASLPYGSLFMDSAGNLYGTAQNGDSCSGCGGLVFEVNTSAAVTTTTLTSSPNPSNHGEPVTFTAVVTSSAGPPPDGETVTFTYHTDFFLGTGTLSGGSASITTSGLLSGRSAIKAEYGGDFDFTPSTSNTVKQVVEK
ncbi:MAG: choice-of-anchor tandem repeat GloVer-containing protein [Terriglobales bacterium]